MWHNEIGEGLCDEMGGKVKENIIRWLREHLQNEAWITRFEWVQFFSEFQIFLWQTITTEAEESKCLLFEA